MTKSFILFYVRSIFGGRRKYLTTPLILLGSLIFWPFLILGGILYFTRQKISHPLIKFPIMGASSLILVPIGCVWAFAFLTADSKRARLDSAVPGKSVAGITQKSTDNNTGENLSNLKNSETRYSAEFLRVIDGDTIEVKINQKNEKIRIIGINTPETVDPRKKSECMGKEASEKAIQLFASQKTIILESDPSQSNRDKYDRLLRFVWMNDGTTDYGRLMISLGYAQEYTYDLPYKYQLQYREEEQKARELKVGLWTADACNTLSQTGTQTLPNNFGPVGTDDKDCKDFASQGEAQFYFDSKGGSTTNNVDNLDGSDKDGKVCEGLH